MSLIHQGRLPRVALPRVALRHVALPLVALPLLRLGTRFKCQKGGG